jgi:hypothetical protein
VPAGAGAYQTLRRYDVRLDSVLVPRDASTLQVFVTLKNGSGAPLYVTSGEVRAQLTDADGATRETGQLWRASGAPAQLFSSTPVVQPGGELRVRYVFPPDAGGAPPRSLTLVDRDRRAEFDLGARR